MHLPLPALLPVLVFPLTLVPSGPLKKEANKLLNHSMDMVSRSIQWHLQRHSHGSQLGDSMGRTHFVGTVTASTPPLSFTLGLHGFL